LFLTLSLKFLAGTHPPKNNHEPKNRELKLTKHTSESPYLATKNQSKPKPLDSVAEGPVASACETKERRRRSQAQTSGFSSQKPSIAAKV